MSGDPDVLEYYKNEHFKKPLQGINTNELTFYLVAETEADMNRWVQSIYQICCFSQTKGSTDALRNLSSVSHSLRSSSAEFSSSSHHLLRVRKSSALSYSIQLPVPSHIQPALSASAPQEYQHLHQCIKCKECQLLSEHWTGE
ncbi:GRB2-associated-binding protein 2 [Cricetulus griseus]|uniref:GRB2-associated-binding protein 2 n=1 Tax=Cricetulus griseus TaxID=10029 RepID=G3GVU8_CRIGR|nr:GRB2-associated-binding protein 2 [Cricetulus griseus]